MPTLGARRGQPHSAQTTEGQNLGGTTATDILVGQVLTCQGPLSPREISTGVQVLCSKAVVGGLLQCSGCRRLGPWNSMLSFTGQSTCMLTSLSQS